ncbi:MAG: glycosyltransferase family 39 protein [Pseudomonadota bacterium]
MSSAHPDGQRRLPLHTLAALATLLLAFLLYLPGTNGPFLHDDLGQITRNPDIAIDVLTPENLRHADDKYPSRPLPMVSFALNHLQCGKEPHCYKLTNVALHLLTAAAIFFLLRSLARAGAQRNRFELPGSLVALTTALWLLHPLHVSTTLYVVQRMTIMATLFSVLALACYLQARFLAVDRRHRQAWAAAAVVLAGLGLLSKENAVLVVPMALLLELLLLDERRRSRITHPYWLGAGLAVAFLAVLALAASFPPSYIAGSYRQRDFLPVERLLTEARILWFYVSEILWPDQARMNIYLDAFAISRSLLDPAVTLAAVSGWLAVIGCCLGELLRRPSVAAFGILLFVAGHLLESSLLGLVLAYEHRNYLPALGLLLALAWTVHHAVRYRPLRHVLFAGAVTACAWQLAQRVEVWSTPSDFANHLMHPRWAGSYSSTLDIAGYYESLVRENDDPAMQRIHMRQAHEALRRAVTLSEQPATPLSRLLWQAKPHETRPYWQRLQEIAATRPVTPEMLNAANSMALCMLSSQCHLDRREFSVFIDALVANPRKNRISTALLKRAAGTFYIKIDGQPEKGLALSREAAELGMPEARESYIKNLGFLGRREEAEALYRQFADEVPLDPQRRARIEAAIASPGVVFP